MPLIKNTTGVSNGQVKIADELVAILRTGASDERWVAARELGDKPGSEPVLIQALEVESDQRIREAIFTSLITLNSDAAVAAILPYLRDGDAALRTLALDALKAMPDPTQQYIAMLLADADPDIRILSCEIVRDLPAAIVVPMLLELLLREPAVNVCGAVIDALAEIGTPEVLPYLERCLARFPQEPYLDFAVKIASSRLSGSL